MSTKGLTRPFELPAFSVRIHDLFVVLQLEPSSRPGHIAPSATQTVKSRANPVKAGDAKLPGYHATLFASGQRGCHREVFPRGIEVLALRFS